MKRVEVNINAELMAAQMMLVALINSHPDKAELLRQFDVIRAGALASRAASRLGAASMPPDFLAAFDRYRLQIETQHHGTAGPATET